MNAAWIFANNETGQSVTPSALTCQRISTDVVVCGVTERIAGASSGAEAIKSETDELN